MSDLREAFGEISTTTTLSIVMYDKTYMADPKNNGD